ncbi:TAXI family TRAP transporter solute-binding subunit [Sneathiella sp. DP05]|uniref:TAXI family TRAP transporter solute-binding subunit n=1 Tax=Sneathiella litorea TaxID=2606216 RepID=A0A6L8W4D9_9PROT|nr:TAXI family TRAP transporter solute-binding subunit [Sneathiella litorea]MZR29383.1 TAXI family TRAP transporter solute-binding subunit [Sneathiella litorea]
MILFCLTLAAFHIGSAYAQNITFLRIGTGSTAGTYYPIGTLLASVISNPPGSRACEAGGSCGVPDLIATAQTTHGSIDNINGIVKGYFDTALAQSDMVAAAYNGTGVYGKKNPITSLRVIANLYPEDVHLVVRRGAGIQSIKGLKGKRVSIDVPGSGTRENAKEILRAYGLSVKDVDAITANPDKSVSLMKADKLDAFFLVAGYPVSAVSELADVGKIELLPISGKIAEKFVAAHGYYSVSKIPSGTYRGLDTVPTLAVSTQWIVNENVAEDLVYKITKALWHSRNRHLLDRSHVKGLLIHLDTALKGVSTPLHPGAERYYREIGILAD